MNKLNLNIYTLCLFGILTIFASCKQEKEGFIINGTMGKDLGVDSVFIYDNVNNMPVKRVGTKLVDGKFTLTGKVDTIKHLYVGNVDKGAFLTLILENDTYDVTITDDDIKTVGGDINTMVLGYFNDKEFLDLGLKNADLSMKALDEEDEDIKNELIDEVTKAQGRMIDIEDNALFKVIDDPKKPAIARLLALIHCQNFDKYSDQRRRELLDELDQELDGRYDKTIKGYRSTLDQIENTRKMQNSVGTGKVYKPIKGIDAKGNEISIQDHIGGKNKYTLLEFWASWCGPCRSEIPVLKEAYKKYHKKGFEIYSFSIDAKEKQWRKALHEEKTNWIQVLKQGKAGEQMVESYGVDGIPASFLIDQDGKIIAANDELRGENLDKLLNKLLK